MVILKSENGDFIASTNNKNGREVKHNYDITTVNKPFGGLTPPLLYKFAVMFSYLMFRCLYIIVWNIKGTINLV